MALGTLIDSDTSPIVEALGRGCDGEIVSLQFRAKVPPVRTINEADQWLRLRSILGCAEVYDALGINSLGIDIPAMFHYATGLETIGTLANLLIRCGLGHPMDSDEALALARSFLDRALGRRYDFVEAYSSRESWCDSFPSDGLLNETVLIGHGDEWLLLAVTWTD